MSLNRSTRKRHAAETVQILKDGFYDHPEAGKVEVAASVKEATQATRLYRPEEFDAVLTEARGILEGRPPRQTRIEVVNESTLAGADALRQEGRPRLLALNFASAKNPGGGFLNGAQAQEESLARSSALYPTLQRARPYYDFHRRQRSCLYSHHMIYSPDVPVLRDEAGELLAEPWPLSFVTSAAVNAGVVRTQQKRDAPRIGPVMSERIERLLALAVVQGHDALVLGAWGCGVFRNDPVEIATLFARHLRGRGAFAGAFEGVRFSVLAGPKQGDTLAAFERALS